MKKINKYILGILLIGVGHLFQACDDFLEIEPVSSVSTGNAFETPENIEAGLVSGYNSLRNEFFTWDAVLLGDVRSDNCYAGPPSDVDIYSYDALTIEESNVRIFYNWRDLYRGISNVNLMMEKIENVNGFEEGRREQIIGEAKFLRALYYFNLVKLYGGVPLMKTTGSADASVIQIPRSTEQEVYDFIVEDLEYAIVNLPASFDDEVGRATSGAANALLAKVWAQSPSQDYNKVISYCDAVIDGGYRLLPMHTLLFNGDNYNNSESIFEIQYKGGTPQGNWGPQLFLPPSISGDNWRKYATPSVNLINAFRDEGDNMRLSSSVIWEKSPYWVDEFWSPSIGQEDIPFPYKQKHADGWNSGDQFYILRLADIILLKAEAQANLGIEDRGRALLNQIRKRARLRESTASDEELADAILNERRLELAFEAHRWDDLVRAGKVIETMNNLQEFDRIKNEFVDYNMTASKILLPIPLEELDRNPALERNP